MCFFLSLSKELPDEDGITARSSSRYKPTLVKSMLLWISVSIYNPTSYFSLISFFLIIFLYFLILVINFISVDRLIHILMPWSNIDFLQICSLNRGILINELLRVSYMW